MSGADQRLGDYMFSRRTKGEDGLPTLSVTLDRGLVLRDSLDRKTDTNLEAGEHLRVLPGDIAYNMMRMWQGASGMAEQEAIVSPAYVVLAAKPNLDPRFAAYLFKTPRMIHSFWAYSYGLTNDRLRLYPKDALKVPVDIPPLPEQRKIAEILSTWDRAIETAQALLATARTQKRALMQTLLTGKRRFPEFEGQDWREVRLGDVARVYDGTHATPKYVETGIPFYSVEHLTKNDFSKTKFISDDVFEKENRRVKLERGDILMTRIGDIGTARLIDWDVRASFYVSLALIKSDATVVSRFLSQYFNSQPFQRELHKRMIHVAFPKKINLGEIGNCMVVLPPIPEQERIASVLGDADYEVSCLIGEVEKLRTEKKALMQQLLTGKRRVHVDA